MKQSSQLVLAIESAIAGGSISLLKNGSEIASWIGDGKVSKAEDLLANLDAILRSNGISRRELELVAVSAGPGSFTGIRIGIATALGIKNGLYIAMASESTLNAMAFAHEFRGNIAAVLPLGRNAVCFQEFTKVDCEITPSNEPRVISEDELHSTINGNVDMRFLIHPTLGERVSSLSNITVFEKNLAFAIGVACEANRGFTPPIFLSKTF